MSMMYEAVKVDEELGGEEVRVKEVTNTAPSPDETHSKITTRHCNLIVVFNVNALGCFLLINLNVSHQNTHKGISN